MELTQLLTSYGLLKNEAKVYLKTRELGSAPVASIARQLSMNKVTVYSILKNLIKRGVSSIITKGDVAYYSVVSPEILKEELEQKAKSFAAAMPEFMAIAHTLDNKPKVEYFEGLQGLKSIYRNVLEYKDTTIRMFMGVRYIHPKFKEFIDTEFLPERVERNITAHVIAPKTEAMIAYNKNNKEVKRKMILVDPESFDFTNEIIVYGENKVAIAMFSADELTGMIIHSPNVHKSFMQIFDTFFKLLKK